MGDAAALAVSTTADGGGRGDCNGGDNMEEVGVAAVGSRLAV